jgi:hypothetical protein
LSKFIVASVAAAHTLASTARFVAAVAWPGKRPQLRSALSVPM